MSYTVVSDDNDTFNATSVYLYAASVLHADGRTVGGREGFLIWLKDLIFNKAAGEATSLFLGQRLLFFAVAQRIYYVRRKSQIIFD